MLNLQRLWLYYSGAFLRLQGKNRKIHKPFTQRRGVSGILEALLCPKEGQMMIDTVLFDLDGTLLPMDQEEFVNTYLGLLAKKLARI